MAFPNTGAFGAFFPTQQVVLVMLQKQQQY